MRISDWSEDVFASDLTNLDVVAETVNRRDAQIETMLTNLIALSDSFGDNTATLAAALVELGSFGTEIDRLLTGTATELDRLLANLAAVTAPAAGRLPELVAAPPGPAQAKHGSAPG